MTAIWDNPEFLRNVRSQLRPGKVAATAIICGAISIVIGYASLGHDGREPLVGPYGRGMQVLQISFWLQALMLAVGGGIGCVNSIYREKDQNTFDYQRVTRMTPLELALGKLFGAPAFTYFVTLCLMPLAIFGAVVGKRPLLTVAAAYAVLLVASVAVHTLALLISLLTVRGSHTAAILALLVVLGLTAPSGAPARFFRLQSFGPFYAGEVLRWGAWQPAGAALPAAGQWEPPWAIDFFFGREVHHVPLLMGIDLLFAAWFLLGLVRNIKRDPGYYEIYSPLQALGLAMFLNFLFVAFYWWGGATPLDSEATLLTLNIVVFFCLGLGAIRNRERARRILRSRGGTNWLDLTWPAPLLISGTVIASTIGVCGLAWSHPRYGEWDLNLAVFRALFFVAWIARDVQFLQWMSLRRGKHPLVMGVLFQVIFYVCVLILMAPLEIYSKPERTGFSAFFLPSAVYLLDHSKWALRPAIWAAAFVAQWVLIAVFIGLQKQNIDELNAPAATSTEVSVPAQT